MPLTTRVLWRIGWAAGFAAAALMLAPLACQPAKEKFADPNQVVNDAPRPVLSVPFAAVAPKMDGAPDDPAWSQAARIAALAVSLGPDGQGLSPAPTEVLVLWDANYLYARFLCTDDDIFPAYDDPNRDLLIHKGDVAEIFLDPVGDQMQYFELQVNPSNYVLDQVITVTAKPVVTPDLRFDWRMVRRDVWVNPSYTMEGWRTAAGRITAGGKTVGWIADFAIPAPAALRRLGLKEFSPRTLRINFLRYDYPLTPDGRHKFVAMNWAPVMFGCPHVSPAAMGYLKLK